MSGHTKESLLAEMRRTARLNGGKPLGSRVFEKETGIAPWTWKGKYWTKYSDFCREAGYEANTWSTARVDPEVIIEKYIGLVRKLGKIPTQAEMVFERTLDHEFPHMGPIRRMASTKLELLSSVIEHCAARPEYGDVIALCEMALSKDARDHRSAGTASGGLTTTAGFVYLFREKRRGEYKIGRTTNVGRRLAELQTASPGIERVHEIATDDQLGVEAYWHERFKEKSADGEWFKLTAADVASFGRWKRIS